MKKKLLLKLLFFLITALLAPQSWSQEIFVNEIHYDNASSDTNEGIEVAGPAGLDLSGYSLVLYNGANSEEYRTVSLNGVIPELQGGFGVVFFDISGLQNYDKYGVLIGNCCQSNKFDVPIIFTSILFDIFF